MRIRCVECGYEKDILEHEIIDEKECELCGGKLMPIDCAEYIEKEKQEISMEELVILMVSDIMNFGEDEVWNKINCEEFIDRILMSEIFFEAKRRINDNKRN